MDIKEKIRKIIADVAEIPVEEITDDILFRENLELDSMLSLEVLAELEHEFNIKIPEEELAKFTSLSSVHAVVQSIMNKA